MIDLRCDCVLVRPWPEPDMPGYIGGGDISTITERCEDPASQDDGLCDGCREHCGMTWDEARPDGDSRPGWRFERKTTRESAPVPREVTAGVEG